MTEFTITAQFPVSPQQVYEAWLDGEKHSAMTGGEAHITPAIDTDFTTWDNYISGKILELVFSERIVQSWRTTEFSDTDDSSKIEITLEPKEGGTLLTLHHSNIPNNQSDYEQGWHDHYFEPMKLYFENIRS